MDYILIDTSAWLNFLKNIKTSASEFLNNHIGSAIFFTCPTVVQEVLQGIVLDRDEKLINSYFGSLTKLKEEPYQIAGEAAELYKFLQKQGVTIRKPNDCLIAMYAIKNDIPILHDDKDFDFIAAYTALKIIK